MLDLFGFAASISYLLYAWLLSVIHRRLYEVDGEQVRSLWIFNQPRILSRYWVLADEHHWSRIPVFGTCIAFLCGLVSCGGVIAILIAHKR